ncbi:TPA: ead/Ea22-like family protein [Escherichia coli]|uniref:Ead/Ea22-like family protein n=1 Tax=Escherichia coli TaxID=562 RepID=A0A8S7QJR8_ECOLX|nr:ead/Ea22-like family protein [Escherichia coli]EFD1576031.1 ead/Ea22-like family protein [Escherichia coli]EFH0042194.1 ead/Ea22-like family protein [Escherichia coli]EHW2916421.1 ead/Ea22-like family protein [Escherichia coli]EJL3868186.1 ead/Ea22-like family protein [Escherichia coli]MCN6191190.1 ead/Ea22-like family protein [Escherichia coli]
MSEIDYQALRERYSPKPVPECSVCGEEMSIQRISGAHVTYACSGYGGDGDFKIGRTLADEHYEKSRVTVVDDSDPDVIALLDELEAAKLKLNEQREYYEGVISDGSKRIAELEAREIKPAKGEVLVVVSGFTGCGKSAIAGEIEIAMKAIGVPVQWTNGDAEKHMTGADWLTAIEMYKPNVRIVEVNVSRAAGIRIKGE